MRFSLYTSRRFAFISTLLPTLCLAQSADIEAWNAKFQATYVWQTKLPFPASYSGPNSLKTDSEKSYSFTATAALGVRPWPGGELYGDVEGAQGVPLSNLTGLGGFTNGEIARTAGSTLKFYRARLFLRQTWGLGGEQETRESDANQLAGAVDQRRLVLTAGNLSVLDIFDDNAYSHDPRTQFLNWSIMTYGAYDYAADARGYTRGVALEWYYDAWVLRGGRFLLPKEPNQLALDSAIFRHHGDQLELEHRHTLLGRVGKLRLLFYRDVARMSRYQDALNLATMTSSAPDINDVRNSEHVKSGAGVNLEQELNPDVGVFARAMWADGKTETYAFTEIDRSLSGGMLVKGRAWRRVDDVIGIAFARNGLSREHRNYLAAGGLGFFIGDGQINYRPETILETFYSVSMPKGVGLTVDWQYIRNPAYNADRGPVNVASMRLHTEF